MNAADVNLYLVGFMGSGKSTVGRAVAQRLGFTALDSDHEIERLRGCTIAEIFAGEGEAAFRVHEREFITGGHPAERTVVACGGGLVMAPGMLELLRARGVSLRDRRISCAAVACEGAGGLTRGPGRASSRRRGGTVPDSPPARRAPQSTGRTAT